MGGALVDRHGPRFPLTIGPFTAGAGFLLLTCPGVGQGPAGFWTSFFPGLLLLGAFHAAYLAEIFRGAVESIGASQLETARAVGFNTQQTYRYVIIPQALRRALPGTTGQLVSLLKDSSLLSVIGIEELVQKVKIMNSASYTALEGYIPLAIAYLIVTLPLSHLARRLERRFAYET